MLLAGSQAFAGDRAEFDAIGFSEDGRYFAFEEFGVQDGSGFSYSNIFLIDLVEDKWVGGAPFRFLGDSEEVHVDAARREVGELAGPALAQFGIEHNAVILALNGDGETGHDGSTLSFGVPGYALEEVREPSTMTIETFPAKSPQDCELVLGGSPLGYALTVDGPMGTTELHRDGANLPASRGCAMAYRIYGVVAPQDWFWNAETPVAIISVYPFGYEGPDRRFLALPIHGLP